jgi:predicted phosphodiesterase
MQHGPIGFYGTYEAEILELLGQYNPRATAAIIKEKYGLSNTVKKMAATITKRSEESPPIVKPLQTTNSSTFHALKTELGLHENIYGLPQAENDEIKIIKLPTGCDKILYMSDVHVPFHTIEALTVAIKYGIDRGANCIYLNGDIADCYSISRFEKEKRLRNLNNEIEMTREFLGILRAKFPNAQIYYKMGNHEMRWNLMIRSNAKEFEGVADFEFSSVFRFDNYGIIEVGEKDIAIAGDLSIIHGHEMYGGGGINPARSLFLKAMKSAIMGHVHRTSEYSGKTLGDKFITCWSTGCLSQLRPKYNPLSQYNHGFAFIETDRDNFYVQNKRIDNGKIY